MSLGETKQEHISRLHDHSSDPYRFMGLALVGD